MFAVGKSLDMEFRVTRSAGSSSTALSPQTMNIPQNWFLRSLGRQLSEDPRCTRSRKNSPSYLGRLS